jgi:hypothetical protein
MNWTSPIPYYNGERHSPLQYLLRLAALCYTSTEVEIINDGLLRGAVRDLGMVTISSNRPPVAGRHPSHLRDYEYKRLGTVSLPARLDLHA